MGRTRDKNYYSVPQKENENFGSSFTNKEKNYNSDRSSNSTQVRASSFRQFIPNNTRKYEKYRSGKSKVHNCGYKRVDQYIWRSKEYVSQKKRPQIHSSKPSSPVLGSQEYTDKKIEQTSAIIMRQLLNPYESLSVQITNRKENETIEKLSEPLTQEKESQKFGDLQSCSANKNKKKLTSHEVEEIHERIMCHLSNLNKGRKKNLINSQNSGYDATIQHFVKQQRLEISRALRNMCSSNQTKEPSELINSIIPDIGIKLEELPREVIEELSQSFGTDVNVDFDFNGYENSPHCLANLPQDSESNQTLINTLDTFFNEVTIPQNSNVSLNDDLINQQVFEKELPITPTNQKGLETETGHTDNCEKLIINGEIKIESLEPLDSQIPEGSKEELTVNAAAEVKEEDTVFEMETLKEHVSLDVNQSTDVVIEKICAFTKETLNEYKRKSFKKSFSTQTDFEEKPLTIDLLMEKNFTAKPSSLSEAVTQMVQIDEWVSKLTKFRQKMFEGITCAGIFETVNVSSESDQDTDDDDQIRKKRKIMNHVSEHYDNDKNCMGDSDDGGIEEITYKDIDESPCDSLMRFEEIDDVIVVIKIVEDRLVAASETGKIYICSLQDGRYIQILSIQSRVTSVLFVREGLCATNMYVGAFRDHLQVYSFHSYHFLKRIPVGDTVECMDSKWGYIFIGCVGGWLQRYSIERENMEYEEKFNDGTILALKATVEGPRRILLVATEDSPLCIRDAMNGLHLRVMASYQTFGVLSLIIHKNFIYCGTNSGEVLVLSFHKGTMVQTIKVPDVQGKVCMKIYRNVLFMTFRETDVHLYDIDASEFIGDIEGPGGCIVSMDIVRNQLIVGTNLQKFKAIPIEWKTFKNR